MYDYTLIKQVDSGRYRIIIRAKVLPPYFFATGCYTAENRISYEKYRDKPYEYTVEMYSTV